MTLDEFLNFCRHQAVPPLVRLWMAHDGTVVQLLEAALLQTIQLRLVAQHERVVDPQTTAFLSLPKGEKGMERVVWLTGPGKENAQKILMARSIFPVAGLPPRVYQQLQMGIKPLGVILREEKIPTHRNQFEIFHAPFPEMARALALPDETPIWTRRYRLTFAGNLSVSVFEALSPFVVML